MSLRPLLAMVLLILAIWIYTRWDTTAEHVAGEHAGSVVSLGADDYHAEVVLTADGRLQIFLLGRDATRLIDVREQSLSAYVRGADPTQAVEVTLQAKPQPGDGAGRTSRFTARLPRELQGQAAEVLVPCIRIGSERFRIHLPLARSAHPAMPTKVADRAERALYLTPGGKYTEADIEANGRATASEKFVGFQAEHDLSPQPGDPLCPITRTKAHPQCTWIIDGQCYQFCCPPCVDEFVRRAKTTPEKILPPAQYTQR